MPIKPLLRGLGDLLREIPLDSIHANSDTSTTPEDLITLTSYNLCPKNKRAIIVPGSPSAWMPGNIPKKIKPDTGKQFMDPNRHIFPMCPLEPLLRALSATQPDFNLKNIDLVTDRRNLRSLLDFVGGGRGEFRIEVEVVQSTVLFSTWTKSNISFTKGFAGYGHEFEKKSTRQPEIVKGSISHYRAIYYVLGGIRIIVRFEVDGFVNTTQSASQSMMSHNSPSQVRTPTGLTILARGYLVDPAQIIEIKTGPTGKNLEKPKNIAQLWFSQTPLLCIGHYDKDGLFSEVTKKDLMQEGKLARWEEGNREKLKKLLRVIEMIMEAVKTSSRSKCILVSPAGSSVLRVHDVTDQYAKGLPTDLLAMWKG